MTEPFTLEEAKEKLSKMTPEDLATLVNELKDYQKFTDEARLTMPTPSTAWADMFSRSGVRINLTGRGVTVAEALDDLYSGIAYGIEMYGLTPYPPASVKHEYGIPYPVKTSRPAPARPAPAGNDEQPY